MMFKIVAVVTLATLCAGNNKNHEPHLSVDHAISSQSFVRHDVPVSYQHTAVHIYTTDKPQEYGYKSVTPMHPRQTNAPVPELQYAPVTNQKNEQPPIINDTTESPSKSNLEPNLNRPQQTLNFVPGYNIEVLQTMKRYPGHNAVYRSYHDIKPNEKRLNKHYQLNQFIRYDTNQENYPQLATTQTPFIYNFVPKQYRTENTNIFETEPFVTDLESLVTPQLLAMNVQLEGYPSHPKSHRLLLNIARTYNIANQPAKAYQNIDTNTIRYRITPSQNYRNIPPPKVPHDKFSNEIKTRLFPVNYKVLTKYY